ncbi:MAG: cyclodeaminase/cyclohydrolase family protein [Clostridiales bacterium]|nr:cyclodeaminase/cyclohydrolase family protein [Clostridiales bacterium]
MEQMTEKSCNQFLTELAGKAPTPGGGGAAALVGALGVALGNMVGNLTTGKKKYAAVEEDIQRLNAKAEALRRELEELVTADAEAFAPLSKAYGLPKSTPEEIAYKEQVMEAALEDACAVPMKIMMRCCDALDLIEEYAEKGSVMAVSDAGCAAVLCKAALQAASLNVFINTKAMQDRNRANQLNLEADILLSNYQPKADAIFDRVNRGLRTYRY